MHIYSIRTFVTWKTVTTANMRMPHDSWVTSFAWTEYLELLQEPLFRWSSRKFLPGMLTPFTYWTLVGRLPNCKRSLPPSCRLWFRNSVSYDGRCFRAAFQEARLHSRHWNEGIETKASKVSVQKSFLKILSRLEREEPTTIYATGFITLLKSRSKALVAKVSPLTQEHDDQYNTNLPLLTAAPI